MRFNGTSGVQVQPVDNLDDLKAFSLISFYIKRGEKLAHRQDSAVNLFIMYLGSRQANKDFIGVALENGNLVYMYNLGGADGVLRVDDKRVGGEDFSFVRIERVRQHGRLRVTEKQYTSTATGSSPGKFSLLDLERDDVVFYVGGVPEDFVLPSKLRYPNFIGCIELGTINDNPVSLYNFVKLQNMDPHKSTPCGRKKGPLEHSSNTFYFDGTGYIRVADANYDGRIRALMVKINMEIRTSSNNALLLYAADNDKFLSLTIQNGVLKLAYNFGFNSTITPPLIKEKLVNDGQPHTVHVIHTGKGKMYLRLDRSTIIRKITEPKTMNFKEIFLGGIPPHADRERISEQVGVINEFKGCLLNFKVQENILNLQELMMKGVSTGCPDDVLVSRKVRLVGHGFMAMVLKDPDPDMEMGFTFRTIEPNGTLLYRNVQSGTMAVQLENGMVAMSTETTKAVSNRNYNDGVNHYLHLLKTGSQLHLVIDDEDVAKDDEALHAPSQALHVPSQALDKNMLYVGGVPSMHDGVQNFTGCISDLFLQRPGKDVIVENLQHFKKTQVSLGSCIDPHSPVGLDLHRGTRPRLRKRESRFQNQVQSDWHTMGKSCEILNFPFSELDAVATGTTPVSRQEFDLPQKLFTKRIQIVMEMRTSASDGMLLYVQGENQTDFLSLFLKNGCIVFDFKRQDSKIRLRSQRVYNDGHWHKIYLIKDEERCQLIVNGKVIRKSLHRVSAPFVMSRPLYLGGVDPIKVSKDIPGRSVTSAKGCIRGAAVNDFRLTQADRTLAVTPCFLGPFEPGMYFASEGSFITLESTVLQDDEIALEVKPQVHSGMLVYMANLTGQSDVKFSLSLYLHQGKVGIHVQDGAKEFQTTSMHTQPLCDGQWHRITVLWQGKSIHVTVDSEQTIMKVPHTPNIVQPPVVLYVGDVPDVVKVPWMSGLGGYVGCLRGLHIGSERLGLSLAPAQLRGAVHPGRCPLV
uniref:Laminin G domain-containing protein n=1 Tax=Eptatretus burgeri TaxID=7764 RepID=A0A8C4NFK5_EPTBU